MSKTKSNTQRVGISVRLEPSVIEGIDELAAYLRLNRSAVINMIVNKALPKYLAKVSADKEVV